MKVAIVTPGAFPLPPQKSGSVEIAINGLADELAQMIETIVFSRHSKGLRPYKKVGKRIDIRIPYHSRKYYLQKVCEQLLNMRPDVVQVENRPLFAWYLKNKLPKQAVILSLHSLTFVESLSLKQARTALAAADRILVNSHFMQSELLRLYPFLLGKIDVCYLGVSDRAFFNRYSADGELTRLQVREHFGLTNKKVLLFVGRLIPIKGIHLLLEVLPLLIEHVPNAHLLIVGASHYARQYDTPYIQHITALIRPLASHVTFTNYLSPQAVRKVYQAADIVVTPSIGKEAFCLVNVEATISGAPVITTNVGGIPEVITHGLNGFIVPTHEWHESFVHYAIRLLTDAELHETLSVNGRAHALERFAWHRNVHAYMQVYQHVRAGSL